MRSMCLMWFSVWTRPLPDKSPSPPAHPFPSPPGRLSLRMGPPRQALTSWCVNSRRRVICSVPAFRCSSLQEAETTCNLQGCSRYAHAPEAPNSRSARAWSLESIWYPTPAQERNFGCGRSMIPAPGAKSATLHPFLMPPATGNSRASTGNWPPSVEHANRSVSVGRFGSNPIRKTHRIFSPGSRWFGSGSRSAQEKSRPLPQCAGRGRMPEFRSNPTGRTRLRWYSKVAPTAARPCMNLSRFRPFLNSPAGSSRKPKRTTRRAVVHGKLTRPDFEKSGRFTPHRVTSSTGSGWRSSATSTSTSTKMLSECPRSIWRSISNAAPGS